MTRCQHCDKLTHSEHLYVEFDPKDMDKIGELERMNAWAPTYMYAKHIQATIDPREWGQLKVGDIYIHFVRKRAEEALKSDCEELSDSHHFDTKPFEVPKDGFTYLCWIGGEGVCFVYWSTVLHRYVDAYAPEPIVHADSIVRYVDANGKWVERHG